MKKIHILLMTAAAFSYACGGNSTNESTSEATETATEETTAEVQEETADPLQNKGIGPITEITLDAEVNQTMADAGKEVYGTKCTACHKADKKYIGPSPKGILERRSPEWVMNMILNPDEMVKEDPTAKALLVEFNGTPMANQNLTEEEARSVLEYFRTL